LRIDPSALQVITAAGSGRRRRARLLFRLLSRWRRGGDRDKREAKHEEPGLIRGIASLFAFIVAAFRALFQPTCSSADVTRPTQ